MRTFLFTIVTLSATTLFAQPKNKTMKIEAPQIAPAFATKDVEGKSVNLSDFKGKKILVSFNRNVGCPICNLRFHELQKQTEFFKSKDLVLLSIYESSAENMKQYLEGENVYAIMIPNPNLSLYQLYDVEISMGKVMKGMFHGAMGKIKQGNKLFKKKMKQDGNMNRISADFLIDENGKIVSAYYGKFVGDHLSVEEIKKFAN